MRHHLLIVLGSLLLLASAALAEPADFGLTLEPRPFLVKASPPLPDPSVFPFQLVLDDDQAEGVFGFAGSTARQFLWFHQFDNPGPFVLKEVWVLFPSGMDVPLGGEVQLAIYLDPDGDPSNGADLLVDWFDVVQAADGDTFSVYPLPSDLLILDPGDILVGAVSRFFDTGTDPPPTRPAALDTTASQDRAWYALWAGDPPPSLALADAVVIDVLDGAVDGNWMIRGFGVRASVVEIPTLGPFTLVLLGILLGGAAIRRLRR